MTSLQTLLKFNSLILPLFLNSLQKIKETPQYDVSTNQHIVSLLVSCEKLSYASPFLMLKGAIVRGPSCGI